MPIYLRRTVTRQDEEGFPPVSSDAPTPGVSATAIGNGAAADPEPPAPPFLSLREAADWLCVSRPTLNRIVAKGDLATVRVGRRRKVPAGYLAAYVARDILLPEQVADIAQVGC
jgi:excisionase family DNA binding protein